MTSQIKGIMKVKAPSNVSKRPCHRSAAQSHPQTVRRSNFAEAGAARTQINEKDFMSTKWSQSYRKRSVRPVVETGTTAEAHAVKQHDDVALAEAERRRPYGPDSAYHLYLREIGQTKLLTPAEEVQLANRIKKGDEDARELMIKANLRLVVK